MYTIKKLIEIESEDSLIRFLEEMKNNTNLSINSLINIFIEKNGYINEDVNSYENISEVYTTYKREIGIILETKFSMKDIERWCILKEYKEKLEDDSFCSIAMFLDEYLYKIFMQFLNDNLQKLIRCNELSSSAEEIIYESIENNETSSKYNLDFYKDYYLDDDCNVFSMDEL